MLDWTGERFVPWAREPAVAYEHLHRYLWASGLARDKRVLDLASGEGYGAEILSREAAFVCGVDADEAAVRHASEKYRRPNLRFLQGSLTDVPIPEANSFDLVVCFEAIEHIREHGALIREVKRLLKPGGIFIVSTPNKEIYREGEPPNPFHVKELSFGEFDGLLSRSFPNVRYFGQRVHSGSSLWSVEAADGAAVREFTIERVNDKFQVLEREKRMAMYFVAVASDGDVPACEGSVLCDHLDELREVRERELRGLRVRLEQREGVVRGLQETVAAQEGALAARAEQVGTLEAELGSKRRELDTIYASRGWKLLVKLRAWKEGLLRLVRPK
jgi:SAM-dependent methyltransferase